MSSLNEIAQQLKANKEPIMLIYAFNSTGKTQLSVEYKNITKKEDGKHTGVYYNAYSEDLFRWDNDESNENENMKLEIIQSSLNPYFSSLIEGRGDGRGADRGNVRAPRHPGEQRRQGGRRRHRLDDRRRMGQRV